MDESNSFSISIYSKGDSFFAGCKEDDFLEKKANNLLYKSNFNIIRKTEQ